MNRYDYEYEWDINHCYPNSHVLKNNLNITDSETLAVAEREITATRIAGIMDEPTIGSFDFIYLRDIHRAIFCDIFAWAGEVRIVDISKGNQVCLCRQSVCSTMPWSGTTPNKPVPTVA